MVNEPLILGTVNEKPRPTIDIYYTETDGEIVGISPSRAEMPEFSSYEVKTVSWDEGSPFLNGEKDMGAYFINAMSVRKELVKRNLVQIYGHDSNFDYFDLSDHGVMVDNISDADITIHYEKQGKAWLSTITFHALWHSEDINIHVTDYKKPMNLHTTITDGLTSSSMGNYINHGRMSYYVKFEHYRKMKVYTVTNINLDLEVESVSE